MAQVNLRGTRKRALKQNIFNKMTVKNSILTIFVGVSTVKSHKIKKTIQIIYL